MLRWERMSTREVKAKCSPGLSKERSTEQSPPLKSCQTMRPRVGGQWDLKSNNVEAKFPIQSHISTGHHCSRIPFPGLPIKDNRHCSSAERVENKGLG